MSSWEPLMDRPAVLSRIGVLGDIHGDSRRLEAAIQFLRQQSALDAILCTGDVANLEADTEGCCRLLQDAGIITVRGNHDRWFLQNLASYSEQNDRGNPTSLRSRAFIASLPQCRLLDSPDGRIMLCHGLGDDDMAGVSQDDSDAML